jgi:hypothetical protein
MNADEKKQMMSAVRAVEQLFFENAALKTVLITNRVRNWEGTVQQLTADQTVGSEMRAKFKNLYEQVEQSPDESNLIEAFLRVLPKSGTTN